jgi:hypothetical protein
MQENKFSEILQLKAKEFTLKPKASAFESILAMRKLEKRRRMALYFSVSTLLLGTCLMAFWIIQSPLNSALPSKPTSTASTMVSSKNTSENPSKITSKKAIKIQGRSEPNAVSKELNPTKSEDKGSINSKQIPSIKKPSFGSNRNKENPTSIAAEIESKIEEPQNTILSKTIAIAEPKEPIANQQLNSKPPIDSSDIGFKQTIEIPTNTKADSIPSLPEIVSASTTQKVKEPLLFNITLYNQFNLLNQAYNGGENPLIEELGIHYQEQAKSCNSLGILFGITRQKFTLKSGFAYTQVQFDKPIVEQSVASSPLQREAFINNYGYEINVIDQSLTYLEMPILLSYKLGSNKININLESGLAFQYLHKTNTYSIETNNNKISYTTLNDKGNKRFQAFQPLVQFSALANYNMGKGISLFAGPSARFHLRQYYKDEFTQRKAPIYFGVYSGLIYNF